MASTGAWCRPERLPFHDRLTRSMAWIAPAGTASTASASSRSIGATSYAVNWKRDRTGHANFVYVGGQGEAALRTIVERSDATAITNVYRRERFIDARQLSVAGQPAARGDAALKELAAVETMDCQPISETWKATTGTTWDLGDKVTVDIYPTGGRHFTMTAVVMAVDVSVNMDGVEQAVPLLEAV